MVNFENGVDPNAAVSSYNQSFMGMADQTVYSDPMGSYKRVGVKSNLAPQLWDRFEAITAEMKSTTTTTGGTGLTDNVLIPISHDHKVVDLTRKQTPAVNVIPRVSNQGIVAPYKQITDKGSASFALENAAIGVNDFTPEVSSVNMKYMYARGSVTGQSQVAAPGHTLTGFQPTGGAVGSFNNQSAGNMNQFNVLIQAAAMRELEEETIFNGDVSTDAKEYSGIVKTMGITNLIFLVIPLFMVIALAISKPSVVMKETTDSKDNLLLITSSGTPPNTPSDPYPEDGATDVPIDVILSWTGGQNHPPGAPTIEGPTSGKPYRS